MKLITNPAQAIVEVGKENSDLHEEMSKVWAELDLYRETLTVIMNLQDTTMAPVIARNALSQIPPRRN